jgi:hypothetical protein
VAFLVAKLITYKYTQFFVLSVIFYDYSSIYRVLNIPIFSEAILSRLMGKIFNDRLTDERNSTIVQQLAGAANDNILLGGNTI